MSKKPPRKPAKDHPKPRPREGAAAAPSLPPDVAMDVPEGGAVVRMYCTGLGDCFLIAFRGEGGGGNRYVLIDFGVFRGSEGAPQRMRDIMRHIRQTTGDNLHVLAVTHEHWDHLSGFDQAKDEFAGLKVGRVWMSWAENAGHPVGREIREKRKKTLKLLGEAAVRLHAAAPRPPDRPPGAAGLPRTEHRILDVLGFFGVDAFGAAAKTEDLIEAVRRRDPKPVYAEPGETLTVPGASYVRAHVLGPPLDRVLLKKSDPTKSANEVYIDAAGPDPISAFYAATDLGARDAKDLSDTDREVLILSAPFDHRHRTGLDDVDTRVGPSARRYNAPDQAWRRIDNDWLEPAGTLGLRLDNDTNNTSLVLAFELGVDGPVLLFPGDAQVGNWLSWETVTFDCGKTGIADLLKRTVLYKVGHHASHNATLREKGLAAMLSPRLVAMIPIDEREARKPKGGNPDGWDMPYPKLLKALMTQASGRVLRADEMPPPPDRPPQECPAVAWEEFHGDLAAVADLADPKRPFFIQYTIRP